MIIGNVKKLRVENDFDYTDIKIRGNDPQVRESSFPVWIRNC